MCLVAVAISGCRHREPPEILLKRSTGASRRAQIEGLEKLIAKAEKGELVTTDQIAVGVSEAAVESLLNASLPQQVVVGKRVRVRLESAQPWQAVEEVVKAQRAGCEAALDKIDIEEILGNIVGKGFNVKIPQKLIKPIRLPAGLKQSLDIQGIKLALQIQPTGLLVSDERLWYGADISLGALKEGAAAAAGPAEKE